MKYEKLLRKLRQRIFDYYDSGKGEKAQRVLTKVKARYMQSPEFIAQNNKAEQSMSERMLRLWA